MDSYSSSGIIQEFAFKESKEDRAIFELVRGSATFEKYAKSTIALRLGSDASIYHETGLDSDLDEIAHFCPNLVEISCYDVSLKLEYFGTSINLIQYERAC
jgi:hypothetical protein